MSISTLLLISLLFSAASFLFYGISCIISPHMVLEFDRYGLNSYRVLTGVLQILGALALLAGIFYTPLGIIGSAGLSIIMFIGLYVRIRLKDSVIKSAPAFLYVILNLWIFCNLIVYFV